MRSSSLFCYFFLFWFPSLTLSYGAFSIKLETGELQCFFEKLQKDDRFDLSFIISSMGEQHIKFWIKNPEGHELHSVQDSSSSFGFNAASAGNHEYCFGNHQSHGMKEVTFTIYGPDEQQKFDDSYIKHDGKVFFIKKK
jgi:hypothetical protein